MNLSKNDYDEIREMVYSILNDLPVLSCEDFHHRKKDQHTNNDCPVVSRFYRNLDKIVDTFGLYYDHPYK